jgi:hypothetical protein
MGKIFWLLRFDTFIWEENDNDQVKHCILLASAYGKPTTMWSGLLHEKWFPRHRQLPFGNTYRMIWMITNENGEYNALFGRHCFFYNEKGNDLNDLLLLSNI